MDQFDQAQELDARYRQQGIDQHRQRMQVMNGDSLAHCLACGDEIPEARRRILPGVTLCVGCAGELERKRK